MDPQKTDLQIVDEALQMLDLALVEWLPSGLCRPVAPTPAWFKSTTAWGSLPFLEAFVNEALRYLHDHLGDVLASEQFTVDGRAEELLLRAHALKIDGRLVLVIERLRDAADIRPILREARQQALEHEALVDRARKMHRPIEDVARAVDRFRDQAAAPHEPLLNELMRAVAALKDAAAALPPPLKTRR